MKKARVGILGGISHESTIEYYKRLIEGYRARCHDAYYPEIVIVSLDFQRFTDLEDAGETGAYLDYIVQGLAALAAAGAEIALMAANSPHAVFEQVAARTTLPLVSIVEATVQAARHAAAKRLLLLGIKFTMQAGFYATAFARHGIEIVTPSEADQDSLNRLIFEELAVGHFGEPQRAALLSIIEAAVRVQPVDGVILGCTELPILLQQRHTTIPLYDTLGLHVQAMLDAALAGVVQSKRPGEKA